MRVIGFMRQSVRVEYRQSRIRIISHTHRMPRASKSSNATTTTVAPVVDAALPVEGNVDAPPPSNPIKKRGKKRSKEDTESVVAEPAETTKKRRKIPKEAKKVRAKSAYSFFSSTFRTTETDASAPKVSLGEMSKKCAEAWAKLADKSEYESMAEADRARVSSIRAETAKPKRAPTAYIRFVTEERAKIAASDPSLSFSDLTRRCAEAWKALSTEEKEAWKPPPAAMDPSSQAS